jgi:hypothetical protein
MEGETLPADAPMTGERSRNSRETCRTGWATALPTGKPLGSPSWAD